jgi:hypothetical protein
MNANREVILVAGGVASEDIYIYDLNGDDTATLNPSIKVNDLVIYNARTNRTITAGATAAQVPKLGIAQAVDPDNRGYPTRLRKVFGEYLDINGVTNVTTEPPKVGCNEIVDFYTKCTYFDTEYGITIHTRGDQELDYYRYNNWAKETFTVNLADFACSSCESGVNAKEVMCALVDRINAHENKLSDAKNGAFRRRALKQQAKKRMVKAYPIFEQDYTYTFAPANATQITGIKGVKIDGGSQINFNNTLDPDDATKSLISRIDHIVNEINRVLKAEGVEGYALRADQLKGTGAPVTTSTILINSCVTVVLVDHADADIVVSPVNPYTAITVDPYCEGCNTGSTWTPDSGIRVVGLAMDIDCDCRNPVDRKAWYHREVDISLPVGHNYVKMYKKKIQGIKTPQGLGVQWAKRILDMSSGGTGQNYDNWTVDLKGLYSIPRKGTAFTESNQGLQCKSLYPSINIQQLKNFRTISNTSPYYGADGRSIIIFDNDDTTTYTTIKARLDPWLTSIGFPAIDLTQDVDQIEATDYADGTAEAGDGNDSGEGSGPAS